MGEEARRGAEFDADGNLISWRLSYLRITELPECIGNCTALQTLNCWCCSSLESLPPSLWQLDIKDLDLGYCKSLDMDSTLERIALNFKNIEKLNIAGTNVTVLTEGIGNCTALRTLNCSNCFSLESLPPSVSNCTALKELSLLGCIKLQSLPPTIEDLKSLNVLDVSRTNIKELPEGLVQQLKSQSCIIYN